MVKKERILAGLVGTLILVLVVRGLFTISKDKIEIEPVLVSFEQPFYAVYFGAPEGDHLLPEFKQGIGTIDERLLALLEGPQHDNHIQVLPQDVKVLGYRVQGDTLYVNFSEELIVKHPGGSTGEIMTVYSIVNSLVDLPGVEQVQILVENKAILTLVGHLDLSKPLKKDYSLLKGLQI